MPNWSSAEIKQRLNERTGSRVTPTEYDALISTGLVGELLSSGGASRADDLLDDLEDDLLEIRRRQPAEEEPRIRTDSMEIRAMRTIQRVEASRQPEVQRFRAEVLKGRLLKRAGIEPWIRDVKEREEGSTMYLRIRIRPGAARTRWNGRSGWKAHLGALPDDSAVGMTHEFLAYPRPGTWQPGRVAVRDDGDTGRLKEIARILISSYGWLESEAVGFILSGKAPEPESGRVRAKPALLGGAYARVALDVDARLGPSDVKAVYSKARSELLQGRKPEPRHRPVGEKACRLAVFRAEHPTESLGSLRGMWNSGFPKWRYTRQKEFNRAVRSAYSAITGQPWRER